LADTPCLDKGFYVLVGNNHYLLQAIRDREPERLKAFLAWLLGAARGYAPKLVNPGGVEAWKSGSNAIVDDIDAPLTHFDVTPRQILTQVAHAANELSLPHPVHIHANNLGMPGNWRTTLATMQALDGLRAHLTHIQFHSYAGGDADETSFGSRVEPLADYINAHPELTVDVGQVLFGDTISLTGDSALSHYLHRIYGGKWFRCDVEMEGGCGVAPIRYRNKSLVHAWQWAIGLEWYLSVNDPWQVVMSTDHPNGGSFLAYPQIVRLLMDRAYRQELLKSCPKGVREGSRLADMDREYSLGEIAIITRAGPARILGLTNKGHLGVGADADVTIYTPQDDKQAMFELPRMVIKAGEVVVDQGEIRSTPSGETLSVRPEFDDQRLPDIRRWFEENYSVQFENYALGELPQSELNSRG
jgi:formylmethanofuran dehydrogenase subunit A